MEQRGLCLSLQDCLNSAQCIITGKIIIQHSPGKSGPGKSASVQLYSSTQVDPNTKKGKLSGKAYLKHGKSNKHNGIKNTTYKLKFHVEPDFGTPGAFVINSQHKHKFFLESATLQISEHQTVHFDCNSWVYPFDKTKRNRLFFSNTSYLPNQTPNALVELRKEELASLRGDGTGKRKEWDRIYDYDKYNDLGDPNNGPQHARPVLGGSEMHPYPRRGRTGRPPSRQDHQTESRPETINLDIYVPPDERFSPKKLSEFTENSIQAAVHFLIPQAKSLFQENSSSFESFSEIRDLFTSKKYQVVEEWVTHKLKKLVPDKLFKEIQQTSKENPMDFPLPQIIAGNELVWKDDEEFGRQMLAGINPAVIRTLEKFPPQSKDGTVSSIKASDIEHNLDGLTINQATSQWRISILDYHDYYMPFLKRINTKGVCAYASRTLLFLRNDATLKPVAIELSLPSSSSDEEISRVFVPSTQGTEAALWQMAKAHVAVNDSGYHQLITHWLKTHAIVEPFIIATRRQLSVMHPIHQLLNPHFKDTMHINALARSILINSGGILENTLFTGETSMEFSSALYKDWRFDEQSLPADLVKRRMAFKGTEKGSGVQLLFEDYPYGADGLDIWVAINTWVTNYCSFFYTDDDSLKSDNEIQAWWSEIRNVGHGDKCNETWWYKMETRSDLIEALTILIWTASALHAAVNFGQYGYAGYPPNHPTLCRKFIPEEGTLEFAEFLRDPDKYYLKMLPEKIEMTLSIALIEVLSRHTSDEEYLGQRPSLRWTAIEQIQEKFKQFSEDLQEVEKRISERNRDPKLKNRWGPANIPYKLLYPDTSNVRSRGGITGKGIPNSISI
ncbi:linoleate 9S-lipoxygenase 6-like [Cornus florida]|uniref:linoleate 9S-lipoxygenase 6-like n=1 Tax=Cornus florida TaxID=4283 RepID=UPI0028A196C9|nr:linoleate 9S-lipoxygenase 6-like [Cornus florida]